MRLRNMLRTQKHRPSQNDTSGIAGTDSTVLATPILNGRRGTHHEGNGAEGGGKKADNGRHLFIHYSASDSGSSPIMEKKQQQGSQTGQQSQQQAQAQDADKHSLSNCSL